LALPESVTLESAEGVFSVDVADQDPTDQPSFSDSGVSAEDILKGIERSPQSDPTSDLQVESQVSNANQALDSVPQQELSAHLVSVSDLAGQLSETTALEPSDQFTISDETTDRTAQSVATRCDQYESVASAEASQEEKPNLAVLVPGERVASETEASESSQDVSAPNVDPSSELPDPAGQDTTTIKNVQPRRVPAYRPLTPVAATLPKRAPRSTTAASSPITTADLKLRLQLVFSRGGDVKLSLVADRREHMPDEVEVSITQGKLLLNRHQQNCYEPVNLSEASSALLDGVEWRAGGDSSQYRWMLSGRNLHVLAEGDVSGLYSFGSTPRLQLNARHVVLAALSLRDDVLTALHEVGCTTPEIYDETIPGVPTGWFLCRNVIPTRAAPMRDGADILNALCPLPDLEPHFVGGIHLERRTWLLGHPPQIRLTGDLRGVEIKLDGHVVIVGSDCSVRAPDWDAEGDHQLWFGAQTQIYTLRSIEENWERWPAFDFKMGATICGASVESSHRGPASNQIRVTATNPLLIGARPGEVFHFHRPDDVRSQAFLTSVPFSPVWALPSDPAHANRAMTRIVMLQSIEPQPQGGVSGVDYFPSRRELQRWVSVLNAASKKRLRIEPETMDSTSLWLRYRRAAKQLRRKLR
jgi:hypothetical protein